MRRLISVFAGLSLLFCLAGCSKAKGAGNRVVDFVRTQIREFSETEAKTNTFEHYTGCRDWYRFPLKYPYHFLMTDILTQGRLEKYNGGDIRDPMHSSECIDGCADIVQLFWNDELVVFDRADRQYGILTFADGACHIFPTQEARNTFLNARIEMHAPEYHFKQFEMKALP